MRDLVDGEELTPLLRAALAVDVTSSLTNFSTDGLAFINADYTLTLSRLPRGLYIGMAARPCQRRRRRHGHRRVVRPGRAHRHRSVHGRGEFQLHPQRRGRQGHRREPHLTIRMNHTRRAAR